MTRDEYTSIVQSSYEKTVPFMKQDLKALFAELSDENGKINASSPEFLSALIDYCTFSSINLAAGLLTDLGLVDISD